MHINLLIGLNDKQMKSELTYLQDQRWTPFQSFYRPAYCMWYAR